MHKLLQGHLKVLIFAVYGDMNFDDLQINQLCSFLMFIQLTNSL